jgi:hypothetical protein
VPVRTVDPRVCSSLVHVRPGAYLLSIRQGLDMYNYGGNYCNGLNLPHAFIASATPALLFLGSFSVGLCSALGSFSRSNILLLTQFLLFVSLTKGSCISYSEHPHSFQFSLAPVKNLLSAPAHAMCTCSQFGTFPYIRQLSPSIKTAHTFQPIVLEASGATTQSLWIRSDFKGRRFRSDSSENSTRQFK